MKAINELSGLELLFDIDKLTHEDMNQLTDAQLEKALQLLDSRLSYKPFPIITIHDGMRTHPNNTGKMKHAYNEVMAEINEGRLFEDIMQQITGKQVNSLGTNMTTEEIMQSKYSIC